MAAEAPAEPVPEGEANEVCDKTRDKKYNPYLSKPQAAEEEVLPPPCMDLTGFPLKTDIFEGRY